MEDEPVRCAAASRDASWLSPVLAGQLEGRVADLVVTPRSTDELETVLAEAVRCEVPVTPRGKGTGNYGQAVPLHGGLVLDCTGLVGVVELGEGFARVLPGTTCRQLEQAARRDGQELQIFPSTTGSTLGGFVAGGAGGSGSIEHGFVWDGFVAGLEVLGATAPVAPSRRGRASGPGGDPLRPFLHAYGTTGVLSELTVRLDPASAWTGLVASFVDLEAAFEAGRALLGSGVRCRLCSVTGPELVASLGRRSLLDPDRASVRVVVVEEQLAEAAVLLARNGGRVDGSGSALVDALVQCSFNHVTLRAKRADPAVFHLQLGSLGDTAALRAAGAACPGARLHLDARRAEGGPVFGGLLIAPFGGEEALGRAKLALAEARIAVVDPHTCAVADPDGLHATAAARMDPLGLLNPGKLARAAAGAGVS